LSFIIFGKFSPKPYYGWNSAQITGPKNDSLSDAAPVSSRAEIRALKREEDSTERSGGNVTAFRASKISKMEDTFRQIADSITSMATQDNFRDQINFLTSDIKEAKEVNDVERVQILIAQRVEKRKLYDEIG